ncbi:MAG TPA: type II toxin-antitoxin system prevent-host-death family antitoxin [Syntrophales bacterium]|nr:MAG: hypothetical protein A2052_02485 [Deltaproteobacteria bacterium GWA2_54_12]HLE17053.1 type II toxin-antitoxin system prevent-host-death family antitoxin [Syntrophales bacterium]
MKPINTKELKAKFRSYLDRVLRGEKVVITDHGKEVPLMVPIPIERHVIRSHMDAKKAKWNGGKPEDIKGVRIKGKILSGDYP